MKKMRSILFRRMMTCGLLLAGVLAASCSREPLAPTTVQDNAVPAISFDAYTNRIITRAGASGDITIDSLKNDISFKGKAGFGVFGYYTGNGLLHGNYQPNYMYNQQVKWIDGHWSYSPLKYWPNEFGNEQSEEVDHVSFFAYAPYVHVVRSTGMLDMNTVPGSVPATLQNQKDNLTGIVALSTLADYGDPLVHYVVNPVPGEGVDLCWGTADDHPDRNSANSTTLTWGSVSAQVIVNGGFPWLNLTRPDTPNEPVKMLFRHATSKLNIKVSGPDGFDPDSTCATRIYLREVSFTGFAMEGALNLNNTVAATPRWIGYDGYGRLNRDPITFHDGRLNGYEGRFSDPGELMPVINHNLVQDTMWGHEDQTSGVTSETVNLFESDDPDAYLYVIPNGVPLTLNVTYDLETKDTLPGVVSDGVTPGISIENRTTLAVYEVNRNIILQAGKSYTMHLYITLKGLTFDVSVEDDWSLGPD